MKKSLFLIIILTILLSVLTGCSGFVVGGKDSTNVDYQKGTKGISLGFVQGAPPEQVNVGNDFNIGVFVKNEGSSDVDDSAYLEIIVPDDSAFTFSEGTTKEFALIGKSLHSSMGEEQIVFFPGRALCFPGYDGTKSSALNRYERKIKVNACYNYETFANINVCIDTLKYNRQPHETIPCKMQDVILSGGQGAPVGVSKVSPDIITSGGENVKVQLSVDIQKVAGDIARIFPTDAYLGCKDFELENEVPIEVYMGKTKMDCRENNVKLKASGTTIICTTQIPASAGAYTTSVEVRSNYKVSQSILKTIKVAAPINAQVNCASLKNLG